MVGLLLIWIIFITVTKADPAQILDDMATASAQIQAATDQLQDSTVATSDTTIKEPGTVLLPMGSESISDPLLSPDFTFDPTPPEDFRAEIPPSIPATPAIMEGGYLGGAYLE